MFLKESDFPLNIVEQRHCPKSVRFDIGASICGQDWVPMDGHLLQLTQLRSLTQLDASGCREITRNGLTHFTLQPERIKSLKLNYCDRITDNFFDYIAVFCRLERLQIRGCFRISDRGVGALTGLRRLRHLDISVLANDARIEKVNHPGLTNESLEALSRMTLLETLHIEGCGKVTDEGVFRLASLEHMKCLNLADTGISDHGLSVLIHFSELCCLGIGGCRLSEVKLMHYLSPLVQLEHLDVSAVAITNTFIYGIALDLNLTHLNISGCQKVDDICAYHLTKMKSLKHLNANDCSGSAFPFCRGRRNFV